MEIENKIPAEVPDELIDNLSNETEAYVKEEYRPFVETIRRIGVSSQVTAIGEAMKDDIRMELQRRITASLRRTFHLRTASIAAAVAMLLAITNYLSFRHGYRQVNAAIVEMKTPLGMQSSIILSDDTKVHLNAGTTLTYPTAFTDRKRELTLSGEAFFEVTSDEKRPFIVKTSQMDIYVQGTSFNVSAYKNSEVSVTLVEGKVEVDVRGWGKSLLSPNETLLTKNGNVVKSLTDVYKYICWKDQVMLLENDPLESVLKKLSLYYGREVSCEKDIENISINGKLNLRKDLQDVIKIIATTSFTPLKVQTQGERIILKRE
ncbi:MAG: FecR domain-containing protein [Tannerella sp.]|jgi:ferric-dicitrate binding protein FerR (iron transport regulator)|nr:FecR domain-containing protein [Tannerella sp.]